MALKDIMAISGQSGLFKFVSQGRNGIIVESIVDGKRTHVSASAKVSALSDISIFTNEGEESLSKVLESIKQKESSAQAISHKSSNDELRKYFAQILPNFDEERVYVSDIKKVLNWYNQLQSINMLDFADEDEDKENDEKPEKAEEESKPKAEAKKKEPAKKAATTKKATAAAKPKAAPKSKPAGAPKKGSTNQKKS